MIYSSCGSKASVCGKRDFIQNPQVSPVCVIIHHRLLGLALIWYQAIEIRQDTFLKLYYLIISVCSYLELTTGAISPTEGKGWEVSGIRNVSFRPSTKKNVFLRWIISVQSRALIATHCDEAWQHSPHSPVALAQLGKEAITPGECKFRPSLMENITVHLLQSLVVPCFHTVGSCCCSPY